MRRFLDSRLVSVVIVAVVAALVYGLGGFRRELIQDDAIYVYAGQRMADGIPPYASIFDHKGPLAPIMCGLAVVAGRSVGLDDLLACRSLFFVISILTAACVLLLGERVLGSLRAGWLASLTFLTYWGFGVHAASGPGAKTPMVLFQVLALFFTCGRRWFWGGLFGSLATLVWQPMAVFPAVTLVVALAQAPPGRQRWRSAGLWLGGVLLPVAVVVLWFGIKGALTDLVEGWVTFNVVHLDRGGAGTLTFVKRMVLSIGEGYSWSVVQFCGGLAAFAAFALVALRKHGLGRWIREDGSAALLLSFPLPFCWSLLDFQGYPDYYAFLPYAALGFGWLLSAVISRVKDSALARAVSIAAGLALIAAAGADLRLHGSTGLDDQRKWAAELDAGMLEGETVMSIGLPEAMVLTGRTNPNPYVFIKNGIDNLIDARSEGGFDGWLGDVDRTAPAAVLLGPTRGVHRPEIIDWLNSRYTPSTIGEWQVYRRLPGDDGES